MKLRKIVSLTLLLSMILLLITSVVLFIEPSGRVAYWADWRLLGLGKTQWDNLHLTVGTLFLLAGMLHVYYNWNPILNSLRNQARRISFTGKDFLAAALITLFVCVGTLGNVPPMSSLVNLGTAIGDRANAKYGEPPYGHAELSSLKIIAKRMDMDLDKAMDLIAKAGIAGVSPGDTVGEIAKKGGIPPKRLLEILQPAIREARPGATALPDGPRPGFGQRSLADICTEYGLHIPAVLAALKEQGITARPEQSFKEIAKENSVDPVQLFEKLHEIANAP